MEPRTANGGKQTLHHRSVTMKHSRVPSCTQKIYKISLAIRQVTFLSICNFYVVLARRDRRAADRRREGDREGTPHTDTHSLLRHLATKVSIQNSVHSCVSARVRVCVCVRHDVICTRTPVHVPAKLSMWPYIKSLSCSSTRSWCSRKFVSP